MREFFLLSFPIIIVFVGPMWWEIHRRAEYGKRSRSLLFSLLCFLGAGVVSVVQYLGVIPALPMAGVLTTGLLSLLYFGALLLLEFSVHRQRIRDSFLSDDFRSQMAKLVPGWILFGTAIVLGGLVMVLNLAGVELSKTLADLFFILGFVGLLAGVGISAGIGAGILFGFQAGIVRKKAYPFIWYGIIMGIAVVRGVAQAKDDYSVLLLGLHALLAYRIFEEYFFARFIHLNDLFNRLQDSIRVRNELVDRIIHSPLEEDHLVVQGMFEESIASSQKEATLPQYRVTGAVLYRRVGQEFVVEFPEYVYGFAVPLYENELIRKLTREQLVSKLQTETYPAQGAPVSPGPGDGKNFGKPAFQQMLQSREVVKIRDLPGCFKGLISFVALYPVVDQDEVTGCLVVYKDSFYDMFPQEDKILRTLAGNLSTVFNIMVGKQLQEERNRLQGEMNIATNIQTSILPREFALQGYRIAASMETATEVGGDVYDWVPGPGGNYLAIGDVSGHGLPAGIMTLIQMSAFHGAVQTASLMDRELSAPELYNVVNRVLCTINRDRIGADKFMTANYFVEKDGSFSHAGAHEIALIYRAREDRVQEIHDTVSRTGFLGISEFINADTSAGEFTLEQGDVLLLYTDGVIEAKDRSDEQFGIPGVSRILSDHAGEEPGEIIRHLREAVRGFAEDGDLARHGGSFADDITLVVIKRDGSAAS